MGWRDWIEPRQASQVSPVSASQNSKAGGQVSQESQLSASQIAKTAQKRTKKDLSGELATVTTATPATDRQTLLIRCREACADLALDPERLAAWLIDQQDPDWMHPAPVRWWAQRIARHGYPTKE